MERYAFQVQYAEIDLTAKDENVYSCPYIFTSVLEALLHFYLTFVLKKAPQSKINFTKIVNPDGYYAYHTTADLSADRTTRRPLKYADINIVLFRVDDGASRVWLAGEEPAENIVEGGVSGDFATTNFSSLSHDMLRGSLLNDNEIFSIFGNCQYANYLMQKTGDALEQLGFVEDVIRMVASEELRISSLLVSPFLYAAMTDFSIKSDNCFRSAAISYQPTSSKLDLYFLRQVFSNMIFHNVPVRFSHDGSIFYLYSRNLIILFEILKEHAERSSVPEISPFTTVTLTEDGLSIDTIDFTWEMMAHVYFHVLQYFAAFASEQQSIVFFKTAVAPYTFVPLVNDHGKLSSLLFSRTDVDNYTDALESMSNLELARFERNLTLRASYYTSELFVPHITNSSAVAIFDNVSYVPLESDVEDANIHLYGDLAERIQKVKSTRAKSELDVAMLCWLYYQRFVVLPAGTISYITQETFFRGVSPERFTAHFSLLDALAIAQRSADPNKWSEVREVRFAKPLILLDFSFCESPQSIVDAFSSIVSTMYPFSMLLKEVYPFVSGYVGEERRSFVLINPSSYAQPTFTTLETDADHETLRSINYKQQCSFKTITHDVVPPLTEYEPNMDVLRNVDLRKMVWSDFVKPALWHNKLDAFYWIHRNSSAMLIDVILARIFGVNDASTLIPDSIIVKANLVESTETLLVYLKPENDLVALVSGAWRIRRFSTQDFFNPVVGMNKSHYTEFLMDAEVHVGHYTSLSRFELGELLGIHGELSNLTSMNPTILMEVPFEPAAEPMTMTEAELEKYRFISEIDDVSMAEFPEVRQAEEVPEIVLDEEDNLPSISTPENVAVVEPLKSVEVLPVAEAVEIPASAFVEAVETPDDAILKKVLGKIYSSRDPTYELTFTVGNSISGELQRKSLQRILDAIGLNENSVMGDIGAGRGNILFHAFLDKKCAGYGWELDDQQFRLYEANRATIKHQLKGLSPALLAKLPRVYHQKVEGDDISVLSHFADITHFYSFDTAMPETVCADIERLLNNQPTWRYFCSTTKTYNYENLLNAVIIDKFPIHTRGGKGQHQVWIFKRNIPPAIVLPVVEEIASPLPSLSSPSPPPEPEPPIVIQPPVVYQPMIMDGTLDFTIGDKNIKKNDVLEGILGDFVLQTSLVLYRACVGHDDFFIGMNGSNDDADLFMVARVPSHAPHTAVALMNQDNVITTVRFDAALFAESIVPFIHVASSNVFAAAPLKWSVMAEEAAVLAREHDLLKEDENIVICVPKTTPLEIPEQIILLPNNNNLEKNNSEMSGNDNHYNVLKEHDKEKQGHEMMKLFFLSEKYKWTFQQEIETFFMNTFKPLQLEQGVEFFEDGNMKFTVITEPISGSMIKMMHAKPLPVSVENKYAKFFLKSFSLGYNDQSQTVSATIVGQDITPAHMIIAPSLKVEANKGFTFSVLTAIQTSRGRREEIAKALNRWLEAAVDFADVPCKLFNIGHFLTLRNERSGRVLVLKGVGVVAESTMKELYAGGEYSSMYKSAHDVPYDVNIASLSFEVGNYKLSKGLLMFRMTFSDGTFLLITMREPFKMGAILLDESGQVLSSVEDILGDIFSTMEVYEGMTEAELIAAEERKQKEDEMKEAVDYVQDVLNPYAYFFNNAFYNRPAHMEMKKRKYKNFNIFTLIITSTIPGQQASSFLEIDFVEKDFTDAQKRTYADVQISQLGFRAGSEGEVDFFVATKMNNGFVKEIIFRPGKSSKLAVSRFGFAFDQFHAARYMEIVGKNISLLEDVWIGVPLHLSLSRHELKHNPVAGFASHDLKIAVAGTNEAIEFILIAGDDPAFRIPEMDSGEDVVISDVTLEQVGNNRYSLVLKAAGTDRSLKLPMEIGTLVQFVAGDSRYDLRDSHNAGLLHYLRERQTAPEPAPPAKEPSESSSDNDDNQDIIMNDDENNNKSVESYTTINTDEKEEEENNEEENNAEEINEEDAIMIEGEEQNIEEENKEEKENENILKEKNKNKLAEAVMKLMPNSDRDGLPYFLKQARRFFINTPRPILVDFEKRVEGKGLLTHFEFLDPVSNSNITFSHVVAMTKPKKELYKSIYITDIVPEVVVAKNRWGDETAHLLSITFKVKQPIEDGKTLPDLVIKASSPENGLTFSSGFFLSYIRGEEVQNALTAWVNKHFSIGSDVISIRLVDTIVEIRDTTSGRTMFLGNAAGFMNGGLKEFPPTGSELSFSSYTYKEVKYGMGESIAFETVDSEEDPEETELALVVTLEGKENNELKIVFGPQANIQAIVLDDNGKLIASSDDAYTQVYSVPEVFKGKTEIEEKQEAMLLKMRTITEYEEFHLTSTFYNRPVLLSDSSIEVLVEEGKRKKKEIRTTLSMVVEEADSPSEHSGVFLANNKPLTEKQRQLFSSSPISITNLSFVQQGHSIVMLVDTDRGQLVIQPESKHALEVTSLKIFYRRKQAISYLRGIASNLHALRNVFVGVPVHLSTRRVTTRWATENFKTAYMFIIERKDLAVKLTFTKIVNYEQVYKKPPVNSSDPAVISSMQLELHPTSAKFFNLVLTLEGSDAHLKFPMHFHGNARFESGTDRPKLREPNNPVIIQWLETAGIAIPPAADNFIFKEEDVAMESAQAENYLTDEDRGDIDIFFKGAMNEKEGDVAARKEDVANFTNNALKLWYAYSEDKDNEEKLKNFKRDRYMFYYDKTMPYSQEQYAAAMYKKFKHLVSFSLPGIHVKTFDAKKNEDESEEGDDAKQENVTYLSEKKQKLILRHVNHEFSTTFIEMLRENAFTWSEEQAYVAAIRFLKDVMLSSIDDARNASYRLNEWKTESVQYKFPTNIQLPSREQLRTELAYIEKKLKEKTIASTLKTLERSKKKKIEEEKSSSNNSTVVMEVEEEEEPIVLTIPQEPLKDYSDVLKEDFTNNTISLKDYLQNEMGGWIHAEPWSSILETWVPRIRYFVNAAVAIYFQAFPEESGNVETQFRKYLDSFIVLLRLRQKYLLFLQDVEAHEAEIMEFVRQEAEEHLVKGTGDFDDYVSKLIFIAQSIFKEKEAHILNYYNRIPHFDSDVMKHIRRTVSSTIAEINFFATKQNMSSASILDHLNVLMEQERKNADSAVKDAFREVFEEIDVEKRLEALIRKLTVDVQQKRKKAKEAAKKQQQSEKQFEHVRKAFLVYVFKHSPDVPQSDISSHPSFSLLSLKIDKFLKNDVEKKLAENKKTHWVYKKIGVDDAEEDNSAVLDAMLAEQIAPTWASAILFYITQVLRTTLPSDMALLKDDYTARWEKDRRSKLFGAPWVDANFAATLNVYWMYDALFGATMTEKKTFKIQPRLEYETVAIPTYLCDMTHREMLFFVDQAHIKLPGPMKIKHADNLRDVIKKLMEANEKYLLKVGLSEETHHFYYIQFILAHLILYHLHQHYPTFLSEKFDPSFVNDAYVLGSKKNRDLPTDKFASRSVREKSYNPYRNIYHQIQDITECILKNLGELSGSWTPELIGDEAERATFMANERKHTWPSYVFFFTVDISDGAEKARKELEAEFDVVALGFENDSGICAIIAIFAQLFYFAPLRRAALTFETTIERCNREGKKMRPVLSTEQKEAEQIMVEFRNLFQHIVESRDSCEIIPLIEKIAENCMIRADLSGNVTEEIFRCILQLEIPKVHDFISMPTVSIRLALNEFSSEIVESQITSGKVSVADARAAAIVVVKFGHYDSHKPTGYSFSYPETVYVESKAFDVYSIALREEHVKEKDLPKRLADIASGISVTNLAHALSAIRGKWQYRESNFSWRIFNNSNSYQISNEELKQRTSGKFVTVPEYDHPVISFPNYVMYVERSLYNSFDWRFLNPAKE